MIKEFETIVEQRGWNDPRNDKGLLQIVENIESRLSRRLPTDVEFTLTAFQKKVIAHSKFWRDWSSAAPAEHLVIQGATSAGKTLLSELNIIDTLGHGQKAIVLVPLKAMVHERAKQFRSDMFLGERYNVYGASSDHMEYDERIINGEYDVAVIVYEKFFSMISQGSSRIMEDCGLLVVDELSMLSNSQRGPKLEIALEIVREKYPETRVMCLATCDCSTERICTWLGVSDPIVSTARPVALEEHILKLNGKGLFRLIPAEHELDSGDPGKQEEEIAIAGYASDWRRDQKQKALLLQVIGNIYRETPDARILVFVTTQSDTVNIARFLCEHAKEFFPLINNGTVSKGYDDFKQKLESCDRDDGQEMLLDELVPHGIAFHHAGISTALREIVEEEFQSPDSSLKLIVATETLTVGVNMPFDAMIMLSHMVYRGTGDREQLTAQEYRNYIGRAGRLGQSNRVGKTYLFVETDEYLGFYWRSYYEREEVMSALTTAEEEVCAPYYLSLLTNRVGNTAPIGTTFTESRLEELYKKSLSNFCGTRRQRFSGKKLYNSLYGAYLTSPVRAKMRLGRDSDLGVEETYAVDSFGLHMAPYALSVATCRRIYGYFYEGYNYGGLPLGITKDEIESDRYLLDILYHICCHDEIAKGSALTYPKDDRRPEYMFKAKNLVLSQLRHILSQTDENGKEMYRLWCDAPQYGDEREIKEQNELWLLTHTTNLAGEKDILQAAMRAILLFYWTQGKTITEIKNITRFGDFTKVINGDIERLAEHVSFHLDAVYKCLSTAQDGNGNPVCEDAEAINAFYALQTRVKYGMARDMVRFANKHIYGLDRTRLLRLKAAADAAGLTPTQFLYMASRNQIQRCLTPTQHLQLVQAIERRSSVKGFSQLMEIVARDACAELDVESEDCLNKIASWDGKDPGEIYRNLRSLLGRAFVSGINRITTDGDIHCVILKLGGKELNIGLIGKKCSSSDYETVKEFFRAYPQTPALLLVSNSGSDQIGGFDEKNVEEAMRICGCNTAIDNTFLAMALAHVIYKNMVDGAAMYGFLADAKGIFTKYDYKHFSPANYIRRERETSKRPDFRIVCALNKESYSKITLDISELEIALTRSRGLGNYEILPWGDGLSSVSDLSECPTVLILEREHIARSSSLNEMLFKMRQDNFENCLLVMVSDEAVKAWNDTARSSTYGCNTWSDQFNKISKVIADNAAEAVEHIREYLKTWEQKDFLIGISYAHYDAQPADVGSECKNDVEKLTALVGRLADHYGQYRILFDRFPRASELFDDRGRERSREAYGKCKLYIILWNYWTKESKNCRKEREVIYGRCENDGVPCIHLQGSHPNDPDVPEPHFAMSLDISADEFLNKVRRLLNEYIG